MKKISTSPKINKAFKSLTVKRKNGDALGCHMNASLSKINKGDWSSIEDFFSLLFSRFYTMGYLKVKPIDCIFVKTENNNTEGKKHFIEAYLSFDKLDH